MPAIRNSELTALSPPDFCPDHCIAFCPATEEHHRPIGFPRHVDIPQLDQGPRLDTGGHGLAPEGLSVPQDGDVTARPDHIGPMIVLYGLLERGAIEFAIAQQHHLHPRWYPPVDLLDQGDMEVFGEMPLLALAHQPP